MSEHSVSKAQKTFDITSTIAQDCPIDTHPVVNLKFPPKHQIKNLEATSDMTGDSLSDNLKHKSRCSRYCTLPSS